MSHYQCAMCRKKHNNRSLATTCCEATMVPQANSLMPDPIFVPDTSFDSYSSGGSDNAGAGSFDSTGSFDGGGGGDFSGGGASGSFD